MDTGPRPGPDAGADEAAAPAAPAVALPDRYRLRRHLGRGGAGAATPVLALDTGDGALVVVKHVPDAAAARAEAEALAALAGNPGVVRLKERHEAAAAGRDGGAFLVLDHVDGVDLGASLASRGGRLDEATLRGLLAALADTVESIHAKGLLHRDLKPANVLIGADGRPVVVDLGAAAPIDRGDGAGRSRRESLLTEGYAAPEQYSADGAEGPWTDVYALGAIAYRAMTGRAPPPAPARRRRSGDPVPVALEAVAADYGEGLRRAVERALAPDPAARPRTAAEWRDALAATAVPAAADDPPPRDEAAAVPADAPGDDGLDDYPPTVRVERAPAGARPPRSPAGGRRPGDPGPGAGPRRRRGRAAVAALAALLVLGLPLAAGGWYYGRPLYERYVKAEWVIDPAGGGDAPTIAAALARAGDGATIAIRPGTYAESVEVYRPVHLTAAVPDDPPLIAPEEGPCLVATAAGGSVAGLRFQAPAAGGEGAEADEGAEAIGATEDAAAAPAPCVDVAGVAFRVEGNTIAGGAGPALRVRDGADPLVIGNTVDGGDGPGLVVAAGAGGTLAQNTVSAVEGPALVVRGGAAPSVTDNTFEGSGPVVFAEGAGGTFARNRIVSSRGSAIEVTTGADPLVADNTIEGAAEAGVFVYDFGAGRFEGNTITGSGLSGVVVATGGRPRLAENTIRESGEHGVLVVDHSGGALERNTIAGNEGHGIALGHFADVELADNQLDGNTEPQLLDARINAP